MSDTDIFDMTAQQIQGPDDLVLWNNGQGPIAKSWTTCTYASLEEKKKVCAVGLHELRIAVALGRPSVADGLARAVDANHLYRLADGRLVSLLHLSIVFGAVDLATVLASMKEFHNCELALKDLGLSVAELALDLTAGKSTEVQHKCHMCCRQTCGTLWRGEWWSWQRQRRRHSTYPWDDTDSDSHSDGPGRWLQRPDLKSKFILGGAQQGLWAPDWSSDLSAARARRDKPSVHAALAAVSQGCVKPSPEAAFHLLDAAILFGNVAAAGKLVDQGVASTPLRLWHASDLLPCYGLHTIFTEDDHSGKTFEFVELDVPEPEVVHAASVAKIDLSSLQCVRRDLMFDDCGQADDYDFKEAETLLAAVVKKAPLATAAAMVEVTGSLEAMNVPSETMRAARGANFQILDRVVQLGFSLEDIIRWAKTDPIEFASPYCLSHAGKAWWQNNSCPGRRRRFDSDYYDSESSGDDEEKPKYYMFDMNILDLAVLHREKDVAMRLAEAGAELTDRGAFVIRGLLVGAVTACDNDFQTHMPSAKTDIRQIAMDLARLQSKRATHAALQIAQIPLLQAMTCVTRSQRLPQLRVVSLICAFMAQRGALADLSCEIQSFADTEMEPKTEAKMEDPHSNVRVEKQVSEKSDIEQAIELSQVVAAQEEGEHVAAALVQSKAEAPPLSGDDVVSFRLTRTSKSIVNTLLEAPQLAVARARVVDAGCELQPDFAGGATILIPMTREQFLELNLDLAPHHVVTIRAEKTLLEAALACVPSKQRPTIKNDHRANEYQKEQEDEGEGAPARADSPTIDRPHPHADGSQVELLEERTLGMLVPMVRHTFIHFTEDQGSAKASVKSAPW